MRSFLERDVPQLGITIPAATLRRFWTMLAHYSMVNWQGRRYGFEFKYGDAPSMTKSMHAALRDLKLERLFVIHPGQDSYEMNHRTEAVAVTDLRARLAQAGFEGKR